ncbi:MAG: hypothetical protein HYU31_02635 [Deltaproteobacteria bacterium]|nr:hypothetical protein [Deltaproteobacteria bacterium]
MAKARLIFEKCIQDSQGYGSDDEHMVSRIFFTLEVEGKRYNGLHADVKQTVGSTYEDGPIEISSPKGASYKGLFNYEAFCAAIEKYYRSLVGSSATGIRIGSTARDIRMRNNIFQRQEVAEFEISGADVAW